MASIVVCTVAVQRIEVITGVGGRRTYTAAEKIRLVGEARTGRGGMAEVARRHGLCTSLLYRWRRQMANGDLVSDTPRFLPVEVADEVPMAPSIPLAAAPPARVERRAALAEVELANGRVLRVSEDIAPAALRRLVGALEG
ncbi:IS66-like element accessory protein TnpA [Azospirillum griseum]|uniref:Transposase n=1 Tax=Azospirillum griseum TaxID=2496639 RepID=A0A3S0HW11_9PROT|nr:transposase [Azospirillum griseum]RTR09913.1 IS66 family insertion sequence hypothetical protein [Azospirillum griseum]